MTTGRGHKAAAEAVEAALHLRDASVSTTAVSVADCLSDAVSRYLVRFSARAPLRLFGRHVQEPSIRVGTSDWDSRHRPVGSGSCAGSGASASPST